MHVIKLHVTSRDTELLLCHLTQTLRVQVLGYTGFQFQYSLGNTKGIREPPNTFYDCELLTLKCNLDSTKSQAAKPPQHQS